LLQRIDEDLARTTRAAVRIPAIVISGSGDRDHRFRRS
jgi:hypothetical protein